MQISHRKIVHLVGWSLLTVTLGARATQAQMPPQLRPLGAVTDENTGVPYFGYNNFAKSDNRDNLYFQPVESSTAVLKLSASSFEPTPYRLPDDLKEKLNFLDFAVTPGGTVWVLADSLDHAGTSALEFNSKGTLGRRIDLDLASGVNIHNFLASDQGILLLSGIYGEVADKALRGHRFAVLFDQSGKLVKKLGEEGSPVDLSRLREGPLEGGATTGEDGSFYLLDADHLIVLNPAGVVVDRIAITKPRADLGTAGLYVSEGLAAIRLVKLAKDHSVTMTYLVVDLSTKENVGWYGGDTSMGDDAVGFSRKAGFILFHAEQGMVHLITATLK